MEIKTFIAKIVSDKTYVDKNNVERKWVNYYVVINGKWLAIRPSFAEGYNSLDTICTTSRKDKPAVDGIAVEIVKIILDKSYTDKQGKIRNYVNFYVVVADKWIAVRPSFVKDFAALDAIAKVLDKRTAF